MCFPASPRNEIYSSDFISVYKGHKSQLMHEFDIESTAEVNGETLNKKPDIALGARERLKAVEGCCHVTWETHHTNYILHADWRLNSRAPR